MEPTKSRPSGMGVGPSSLPPLDLILRPALDVREWFARGRKDASLHLAPDGPTREPGGLANVPKCDPGRGSQAVRPQPLHLLFEVEQSVLEGVASHCVRGISHIGGIWYKERAMSVAYRANVRVHPVLITAPGSAGLLTLRRDARKRHSGIWLGHLLRH